MLSKIYARYGIYIFLLGFSCLGLTKSIAPQSSIAAPNPKNTPDATIRDRINANYGKLPLSFEANQGQADKQVKFLSQGSGYSLFLTPTQAVLTLRKPVKVLPQQSAKSATKNESTVLQVEWVGANQTPQVLGLDPLPGKSNYFIGKDPKKWQTNIPNYAKVQYRSVYPGINLVYYGNQRQLEYDWVVAAGADPRQIKMKITGAARLSINKQGDLLLHTKTGEVWQHQPRIYQLLNGQQKAVAGKYVLLGKQEVAFAVTNYDRSKTLVIDPVLSYSTYLGGSGNENSTRIAVDKQGNAYITGAVPSADFPTTSGTFKTTFGGGSDVFVTKLNQTGSALIYSTYLGGSENEGGYGLAVDKQGNAYITGGSGSADFPTTPGAFQTVLKGPSNVFVTKLNEEGNGLIYSTYLGGSGVPPEFGGSGDSGNAIAVDRHGNAYITGSARSSNFPITPSAFQTTKLSPVGIGDVFVTKINEVGSELVYSTYLGGSKTTGDSEPNGIEVDREGNVYITGSTVTADFPVTAGAFQTVGGPGGDIFVTKLNPVGSRLVYSTYLGGSSFDDSRDIAIDRQGNVYITGFTYSTNFPITPGAFQTTQSSTGSGDTFVTKLNSRGNGLIYSTYLGGNNVDVGNGIAVDWQGNAYITGTTSSTDFPTTPDAFQTTLKGSNNQYLSQNKRVKREG